MKKPFRFVMPNGDISEVFSESELIGLLLQPEEEARRLIHLAHHWKSEATNEQTWRNNEYLATDYMVLPYSRYQGEVLSTSSRLRDIIDYRDKLHDYKYETEEPRPIRPLWFDK